MSENNQTKKYQQYEDAGRTVVERLKNSSIYFQKAPQCATIIQVDDRQEKSIAISLRKFHRLLQGLVGNEVDIDASKKKQQQKEDWIVDAANIVKQRGCWVPSACLEHADRTIRDKVHLMIQRDQEDQSSFLISIGILNECLEILQPLEEPDQETIAIPSSNTKNHNNPAVRSSSTSSSTSSKNNDQTNNLLIQRGQEAVQELLFSSPYYTPQPKSKRQSTTRDRQYDAYKLADQRFKLALQKFVPPGVFQKGNTSHIFDCFQYLQEHPKVVEKLLLETDILLDIKRTRNDRVFIAIQKFYTLTEEGDCFYNGNDSHLRYIGILDHGHEMLSGLKSRTQSVWNIV